MTKRDDPEPYAPGGVADGARQTTGARLTDLARDTGLGLATLSRLLASLEHAGLVRRGPDKRYALGPTLLRLGNAYRRSLRLEPLVAPLLAELGVGAPSRVLRAFTEADPRGDDVRALGWAVSLGERVPELAAVAATVFGVTDDATAGLLGVLSLSGLRSRFDGADLEHRRALVVTAAHRLSASLGAPTGTETHP